MTSKDLPLSTLDRRAQQVAWVWVAMATVPVVCWYLFLEGGLGLVDPPLWIVGCVALAPAALGGLALSRIVAARAVKIGDGFGTTAVGFGLSLWGISNVGALELALDQMTEEGGGTLLPYMLTVGLSIPVLTFTAALVWWWGNWIFSEERTDPPPTEP